jgi:type I restriction enzyme S subunit
MNKNNKHTLVPKLRFPEFQNEGEWEVKKLGEITEFVRNGLNINQTNEKEGYKVTRIETISEGRINIEKVGYIRTLQDIAEYKLLIGDMLFSNINSVAHIGKIAFIDKDYDLYHGMNLLNIRINQDEHCPKFYFYQLTNCRLKRYFEEICNKAVNQASINQTDLKKTELAFPSLPEQQKIAACLSSIDEVITAESQKLELYQQHKKGLLQNLFPNSLNCDSQGLNDEHDFSKVPKLRFPEFEESGEWVEKLVGEYFTVGSSKRVLQEDWTNHGVPFYRTRELVSLSKNEPFKSEVFISEELFSELKERYSIPTEGDFLVSGVGTLGICYQVQSKDKFYFKDGNVLWFKLEKGLNSTYFKYCFQSEHIQNQIIGQTSKSTVGTYTIQNAKKTKFWYPPTIKEQQKIAACLSSLDDLINAQTQKIEMLQRHKKGLLQGLFPPINN